MVYDYAQSLLVIYDDLGRIHDHRPIAFSPTPTEWVWEMPQPTAVLTAFLECQQAAAQAMNNILRNLLDTLTPEAPT